MNYPPKIFCICCAVVRGLHVYDVISVHRPSSGWNCALQKPSRDGQFNRRLGAALVSPPPLLLLLLLLLQFAVR